jgi:hypothetical protein
MRQHGEHARHSDCTGNKSGAFFFRGAAAGTVEELSPHDDDEEPHHILESPCPKCFTPHALLERLQYNASICTRCGCFFDASDAAGCSRHNGIHELPCDGDGNVTWGVTLCDIGGMLLISSVTGALILPGRWTCCGAPCFHTAPECPYAESSAARSSYDAPLYKGCIFDLHTTDALAHPAPMMPRLPLLSIFTCDDRECLAHGCRCSQEILIEKRALWLARIPWHHAPAVRYPSGATLFSDANYDQVVHVG